MSTKQAVGREQVHDAAWGRESYPHPLVSCMMPVATLLVIAVIGLLAFTLWQKSLPANITIPAVTGVALDDAEKRLQDIGLAVEVIKDRQTSETIPAGAVIVTIPPDGRIVKEGRVIRLVISSGSLYTRVPDVVGKPLSEAREMLAEVKLSVVAETAVYDEKVPVDNIIALTPKPGTKVLRNSDVKLTISKGPQISMTPDYGSDGTRSAALLVSIPEDASEPAEVHIDVTDDDGTRTVYRETHNPGDTFVENIEGNGETTAKVYFGNRLILTRKL